MLELYCKKGGTDTFNCRPLVLDNGDLAQLEADITANALPPTEGFFFGESRGTEQKDDLEFVAKARDAIRKGLTVYYDSWW